MFNRERIKKEFLMYVYTYEKSGRINLKKNHILRVADNCYEIAKKLSLGVEDCNLAYLIGIVHDIGRFEQVKLFDTFSDKDTGMDHAMFSNKVLFEDGLIRKFVCDDSYNNIISVSVFNHNKKKIQDGLSEKELLFSQIIRDADKLDILYLLTVDDFKDIFWYSDFTILQINSDLVNEFLDGISVDYKNIENNGDQIIAFYSYIFDFYFKESLKKILANNYFFEFNERIKKEFVSDDVYKQSCNLLKFTNDYLENRIR